jgi:hypothetical protein
MMMEATPSRPQQLNLRRMIHLDEVETLLMSLMETVDRQGREIDDLKGLCRGFLGAQTAHEKFQTFEQSIDELNAAVTAVQTAATSHLDDRTLPAGELATHNYHQLESLRTSLADLVHRSELQSGLEMLSERQTNDVRLIREWATPMDVTNALQTSLQDTSHRITVMEGAVSLKLDRSELSHVEALAQRLQVLNATLYSTTEHPPHTHSTHHTPHSTQHTAHSAQHTAHSTRHHTIPHSAEYTVQHSAQYSTQCSASLCSATEHTTAATPSTAPCCCRMT